MALRLTFKDFKGHKVTQDPLEYKGHKELKGLRVLKGQ